MSIIPDEEDFRELLEVNSLTPEDVEGVCVHLRTKAGAVVHWHYLPESDMTRGTVWEQII